MTTNKTDKASDQLPTIDMEAGRVITFGGEEDTEEEKFQYMASTYDQEINAIL